MLIVDFLFFFPRLSSHSFSLGKINKANRFVNIVSYFLSSTSYLSIREVIFLIALVLKKYAQTHERALSMRVLSWLEYANRRIRLHSHHHLLLLFLERHVEETIAKWINCLLIISSIINSSSSNNIDDHSNNDNISSSSSSRSTLTAVLIKSVFV